MTGRPGDQTMGMNEGSTASYRARAPCATLFMFVFIGLERKGLLDFQWRRGIASVVRWNLRPVIFGVEKKTHPIRNIQRKVIYPPPPPFLARRHFSGEGGGVYFEPLFSTPPTLRRVFSKGGGYKIWPCITVSPIEFVQFFGPKYICIARRIAFLRRMRSC